MSNSTKNTKPKIYLDANVLLEVLLERKHQSTARQLLIDNYGNISISALTAHIVIYFTRKIVSLPDINMFLRDFEILPLEKDSFEWAFINVKDSDLEDALQIAVAVKNDQSLFYTIDKVLYKKYKDSSPVDMELIS